jgi:VanZ family protein
MGLIFLGSTDRGSAGHTSGLIEPLLHWLMPRLSQGSIDLIHHLIRKCAHLTEYAILGGLALRALSGSATFSARKNRWKLAGAALAVAALYAASDEFHQSFVPSRGSSVYDVLIDACGASVGIGATLLWRMRHDKKERPGNLPLSAPLPP